MEGRKVAEETYVRQAYTELNPLTGLYYNRAFMKKADEFLEEIVPGTVRERISDPDSLVEVQWFFHEHYLTLRPIKLVLFAKKQKKINGKRAVFQLAGMNPAKPA